MAIAQTQTEAAKRPTITHWTMKSACVNSLKNSTFRNSVVRTGRRASQGRYKGRPGGNALSVPPTARDPRGLERPTTRVHRIDGKRDQTRAPNGRSARYQRRRTL